MWWPWLNHNSPPKPQLRQLIIWWESAVPKPPRDEALLIRLAIAVGVLEMEQLGALGDVEAAVAELDAAGHEEALDEFVKLFRPAIVVGVLADEDVVVGLLPGLIWG